MTRQRLAVCACGRHAGSMGTIGRDTERASCVTIKLDTSSADRSHRGIRSHPCSASRATRTPWSLEASANRHVILFTVVIRKRGTCNARTEHTL